MSEHDQSRKFADKSATIASETLQKGKLAIEQGFSDAAEKNAGLQSENDRHGSGER